MIDSDTHLRNRPIRVISDLIGLFQINLRRLISADHEVSASATFAFDAALIVRHSVERSSLLSRCTPEPRTGCAAQFTLRRTTCIGCRRLQHLVKAVRSARSGAAWWRPHIGRIEGASV
jgi:hypothetical protein